MESWSTPVNWTMASPQKRGWVRSTLLSSFFNFHFFVFLVFLIFLIFYFRFLCFVYIPFSCVIFFFFFFFCNFTKMANFKWNLWPPRRGGDGCETLSSQLLLCFDLSIIFHFFYFSFYFFFQLPFLYYFLRSHKTFTNKTNNNSKMTIVHMFFTLFEKCPTSNEIAEGLKSSGINETL